MSQIPSHEKKQGEFETPMEQQPSSVLTFSGKEEKLLSLNEILNQVPQESLGLGG